MKSITRIVVTGGPCAGKTTAFGIIEQKLVQRGYKVFIVPETFTDMYNGGIKLTEYENVTFQTMLMKYLLYKEEIYNMAAKAIEDEKVVILLDRGLMDNKAYMSETEFKQTLANLGKTVAEVRDDYDAVIHLVTAANGAESFYSLDNKARYETVEMAREVDEKLIEAWTGHPHLRIIDNSTDFVGKMDRLMMEIYSVLGIPYPIEVERKFLAKMPDVEALTKNAKCIKTNIIQTYLCSENPNTERRIRQRGSDGDYTYYYTEKTKISEMSRVEKERKITEKEYLNFVAQADTNLRSVRKTRYCFVWNNLYFELDVYPFWQDKAILEIELNSEESAINLPEFIDVIKEVTSDAKYKNRSLAENIP